MMIATPKSTAFIIREMYCLKIEGAQHQIDLTAIGTAKIYWTLLSLNL
jgi:hypothetical protein